ncbi:MULTISPECIES: TetR/AcrR family transcriptional regulator [Streptomyces]|uniref:TetR/AcrR family transcriptional regulator n=1 Tax=Streptomyces TaxID=1883 RepID=UPI00163CB31C|nr:MULTISPECIES: TetR/AcrR family transcriptional regulator [Streptomyces]MBC2876671.1 TetR/AcrR family transcriptional regulator [Streptomyces sp. TYQ1024]UBI36301.1 TetR/AcrR family transcriptional regulator [Streptomyces mobaraensis]UKW28895.1 TetR/AcrR family transcriptional regulator [Streptomyces sp. TYQ1024]
MDSHSTAEPGTPPAGLRETKKRETRRLISDHATRLFIEQGFERTTIAEIADAARVAKKTVTNYFPRKEDLALDHQEEFVRGLALTVAAREPGESALAALRRSFLAAVAERDPVAGFAGPDFSRMIADSPTLSVCLRGLHDRREEALAAALAEATAVPADDVTPRAAAAVLGGVHRVLFGRIQALTLAGHGDDEVAEVVGAEAVRAFDLLEPSLGAYARA